MEFKYKYENMLERKEKIKEAESKNLRMVHDDFDANWKTGTEPHGLLTFTDDEEAPLPPSRNIFQELDELKTRVLALESEFEDEPWMTG